MGTDWHGRATGAHNRNMGLRNPLSLGLRFGMIQAVEALTDENGEIRLLEPIKLSQPARALVTILPSSKMEEHETAIRSETSLAVD
jgi:hypothetical protein